MAVTEFNFSLHIKAIILLSQFLPQWDIFIFDASLRSRESSVPGGFSRTSRLNCRLQCDLLFVNRIFFVSSLYLVRAVKVEAWLVGRYISCLMEQRLSPCSVSCHHFVWTTLSVCPHVLGWFKSARPGAIFVSLLFIFFYVVVPSDHEVN